MRDGGIREISKRDGATRRVRVEATKKDIVATRLALALPSAVTRGGGCCLSVSASFKIYQSAGEKPTPAIGEG